MKKRMAAAILGFCFLTLLASSVLAAQEPAWVRGETWVRALRAAGRAPGAEQRTIKPGTVITPQNWRQYKNFMTASLQALFSGRYFWKFPTNLQIVVGPTHDYHLPRLYVQNTEKYSSQVRIVTLPNGEHTLKGYVAGQPFPNPQPPMKGWKLLADLWYTYVPHLICQWFWNYSVDRLGYMTSSETLFVIRRISHNSDPGVPINNPVLPGIDSTDYAMVMQPEQAKYTAQLTVYYLDPVKDEDLFVFIPALRRTLRVSSAARCSPFLGTDNTQDDIRYCSWNAGIARFDADFLGDKRILTLTSATAKGYGDLANYYPKIFFPKPAVGKWEVRDTYVLDLHRIPSMAKGYCYTKKIMYLDKQMFWGVGVDAYGPDGKLWKAMTYAPIATRVPGVGLTLNVNNLWATLYNLRADHLTVDISSDARGYTGAANSDCRDYHGYDYDDVHRYSTLGGLDETMR